MFTLVAILAGSPIRIAISGILWLAVVVVYVVRFKRAMDEPEKLDDELRRMQDA